MTTNVQNYLDAKKFTREGILKYEKLFGKDFVSPGGARVNGEFVAKLDLKKGEKVLDIGCGLGGNSFQMAEGFGAHVHGIDLAVNMIAMAKERSNQYGFR